LEKLVPGGIAEVSP